MFEICLLMPLKAFFLSGAFGSLIGLDYSPSVSFVSFVFPSSFFLLSTDFILFLILVRFDKNVLLLLSYGTAVFGYGINSFGDIVSLCDFYVSFGCSLIVPIPMIGFDVL